MMPAALPITISPGGRGEGEGGDNNKGGWRTLGKHTLLKVTIYPGFSCLAAGKSYLAIFTALTAPLLLAM
jgi:hypothetical protein